MKVTPTASPDKGSPPADWQLLVDQRQAAAMCHVSVPTFRSWEAAGRITPVALPFGIRRKLYRRADVEQFVANLAVRDVSAAG